MANPLPFKPAPIDPRTELNRRLAEAPTEHAEALLVGWDLLQTAHDQGILDLLVGLVGSKDFVAGKLAEYAKLPEGVATIRNLIATVKILGALDPETLDCLSSSLQRATLEHSREVKPPSLFELGKRATGEDARRALSFLTTVLTSLGRALKR